MNNIDNQEEKESVNLTIKNLRAPKGKLIARILRPDDLYVEGIIIPAAKKHTSNEAIIIDIGPMEKDDIYYHDCDIDQYRKCSLKVGDIVMLNFVSPSGSFSIKDENGNMQDYVTLVPETVNAIYKDGQFFKTTK